MLLYNLLLLNHLTNQINDLAILNYLIFYIISPKNHHLSFKQFFLRFLRLDYLRKYECLKL